MAELLFYYFIFPGLLFLTVSGMLASWIDRKVTARLQWRVGPPFLQPFYDVRKLFAKEIIIPAHGSRWMFILAPVASVLAIALISDILIVTWMLPVRGFVGDLIVVLYLFTVPALASILGASASHNPMASLGASREMKLVLSYELPFLISIMVPILKTHSILLGSMLTFQHNAGSVAASLSGFIAMTVAIICLHGKMGLAPFDVSEAETEISAGSLVEYSGALLGLWKISKMMLLVIAPLFIVLVFWSGGSPALLLAKYAFVFILSVLIRNTNPRVRIDQAMRFFWGPMVLASTAALVLALCGF